MAVKLLPHMERLLVEFYAQEHSLREVGKRFGVSPETARRVVRAINPELIRPRTFRAVP